MLKANKSCIERLYRYRNTLIKLKSIGFVKVFSDKLADGVGVPATQVRKDFSIFGLSGNKRGGYIVDELIEKLNHVLGKNKPVSIIVVGKGNIGSALVHYKGFEKEGIKIVAAFDVDPSKTGHTDDIPVLPTSELKGFVKQHNISVGIIAVPDAAAQQVADVMIESGIKGILNFAPIRLNMPEDIIIHHVNLELELETIIYFVNALNRKVKQEPKQWIEKN